MREETAWLMFADIVGSVDLSATGNLRYYEQAIRTFRSIAVQADQLALVGHPNAPETMRKMRVEGDEVFVFCLQDASAPFYILRFAIWMKLLWFWSRLNVDRMITGLFPIELGVGIHIGKLGLLERDQVWEGFDISVAKRVEGTSRERQGSRVVISERAYERISADCRCAFLFSLVPQASELKGLNTKIRVRELLWFDEFGFFPPQCPAPCFEIDPKEVLKELLSFNITVEYETDLHRRWHRYLMFMGYGASTDISTWFQEILMDQIRYSCWYYLHTDSVPGLVDSSTGEHLPWDGSYQDALDKNTNGIHKSAYTIRGLNETIARNRIRRNLWHCFYNLAILLENSGNHLEAFWYFLKAVLIDPKGEIGARNWQALLSCHYLRDKDALRAVLQERAPLCADTCVQ